MHFRYNEAAKAYEDGLKVSPGDEALGRGLDDVLKAQTTARTTAGEFHSSCQGLFPLSGNRV